MGDSRGQALMQVALGRGKADKHQFPLITTLLGKGCFSAGPGGISERDDNYTFSGKAKE